MPSLEYDNYRKSCIDLARSIIIKSDAIADAMNVYDRMVSEARYITTGEHFFDPYNKKTWRYYLNISGQYHVTDPEIIIKSLDNGEDFSFTVENLNNHVRTYKEYKKKGYYYEELIKRFPDHIGLINGILFPVDIDLAINAKENQILRYNKNLVEVNEYNLISDIQKYIDMFFGRWDNNDYVITDDLYLPARLGVLYMFLPNYIMSQRFEKARTIEAHPFHIWAYLGSHQYLDEYQGALNLKQVLWLYRNISWVEFNAGKLTTFEELIEILMTERFIPISKYDVKPDYTQMIEDNDGAWKEDEDGNPYFEPPKDIEESVLYPDITLDKETLNLHDQQGKENKEKTVEEITISEIPEARDNNLHVDDDVFNNEELFSKNNIDDELSTKVVESQIADKEALRTIKIDEVALNEWIYSSTHGYYEATVLVTNPKTSRLMQLTQLDALILYIYAIHKLVGIDIEWIPTISATRILRQKQLTEEQHLDLVDLRYMDKMYYFIAKEDLPVRETIVSVDRFNEWVHKLVDIKTRHHNLYRFNSNPMETSQIHTLTDNFYETIICHLTPKAQTFYSFFEEKEIMLKDMAKDDYKAIITQIFEGAYGVDNLAGSGLKRVQENMIAILTKLSSYSIQFLSKVTEENTERLDWSFLKCRHLATKKKDGRDLRTSQIYAYNFKNKIYEKRETDMLRLSNLESSNKNKQRADGDLDLIIDIKGGTKSKQVYRLGFFRTRFFTAEETMGTLEDIFDINDYYDDKAIVIGKGVDPLNHNVLFDTFKDAYITKEPTYLKDDFSNIIIEEIVSDDLLEDK